MHVCCNPYNISHSRKQQRERTTLVKDFERCRAVVPNFPWAEGQALCTRCRLKILKDFKALDVLRTGARLIQQRLQRANPNDDDQIIPPPQENVPEGNVLQQHVAEGNVEEENVPKGNVESRDPDPGQGGSGVRDTVPSAPLEPQEFPPPDEVPCTSRSAIERDRQKDPIVPTPMGSIVSSISLGTGTEVSSASHSNGGKVTEDLNRSLQEVVISPARPSDIKKPYILRRKLKKWKQTADDTLKRITGVAASPEASRKRRCVFCSMLLKELCEKYKNQDTRADKYKLLTSIPKRFTIFEVEQESGCSAYLAKTASSIKYKYGAFSYPNPIQGRPMNPQQEEIIQAFYLSDDNSRASPNVRDVMRIKLCSGEIVTREKRRVLHNLNDLYNDFKSKHPEILVSISKFSKLRPKNCAWPGLRGHHVTCVCEIHGNFEFLLEAMGSTLSVEDFVKKCLCVTDGEERAECNLGLCANCPKPDVLTEILQDVMLDENVSYRQWLHTDCTDLQEVTVNSEEFKKYFMDYVPKIIEHEYLAKKQKFFIKHLRERTIKETPSITVQVDFAQNYTFVIQNAVQGYHWSNRQATVHPFVVHWWDGEEELIKYKTYCVISDEMSHDADTFHVFCASVIPKIKEDLAFLKVQKVFYVSDGAAGQYKNFKNFSNLMSHQADFGMEAEWHFTATSHGKSTCDAMSAVVKCTTRRQSLKKGQFITTPQEMFNFCHQHLSSPTCAFVYVSSDEVKTQKPALSERYKKFKTINGTRKHHAFIPKSESKMCMGRTSDAESFVEVDFQKAEVCDFGQDTTSIGSFYAFYESNNYQIGLLVEVDSNEGDAKLQVMKLNRRTRAAVWPDQVTFTDVAFRDILLKLNEPETVDGTVYVVCKDDMASIRQRFNMYKTTLKTMK